MTAPANSEFAIDVQDLNKHYRDKHVVNNVSLQVRKGEIFGFLGPNRSGKTTTIQMMCGLLKPDSGTGTCLGYDIVRQAADIKRHVGYMTQRFSSWDDLTISENLDFVARIHNIAKRRDVVRQTIADLGLAAREKQLAGELAGGWKQRMALAACMLHDPQLLLLDEPAAGVDPKARRGFLRAGFVRSQSPHDRSTERTGRLPELATGGSAAQRGLRRHSPGPLTLADRSHSPDARSRRTVARHR